MRALAKSAIVFFMFLMLMLLIFASGAGTNQPTHPVVRLHTADAAATSPAPLPPGAIKQPGESCYSSIQPPDGQACPQRQDTDCVGNDNRLVGECMAARWGWFDGPNTGNEWSCLDRRITGIENSSWGTTVVGYGGAYGIAQALPGYKYAEPNHVEVIGGGYQGDWRTDRYIQIAWMRVYIVNRYKTPCGIPSSGGY